MILIRKLRNYDNRTKWSYGVFTLIVWSFYRPKTKLWEGNVFTPVCHSVHRAEGVYLSACWDTHTPGQTPPGKHPTGQTPPWANTHPWADTPPGRHPPPGGHCRGRYASYWNAFLFILHRDRLNRYSTKFYRSRSWDRYQSRSLSV